MPVVSLLVVLRTQAGGGAAEAGQGGGGGTLRVGDHLLQRHLRVHGHVVGELADAGHVTHCPAVTEPQLDLAWVHPWAGLGWVRLGFRKWTHVQLCTELLACSILKRGLLATAIYASQGW